MYFSSRHYIITCSCGETDNNKNIFLGRGSFYMSELFGNLNKTLNPTAVAIVIISFKSQTLCYHNYKAEKSTVLQHTARN